MRSNKIIDEIVNDILMNKLDEIVHEISDSLSDFIEYEVKRRMIAEDLFNKSSEK
jgi:hypothetical protein